jgi:quinolinate synthase
MQRTASSALQIQVRALAADRDAVILAHNYQRPEVQDLADFVGDSLGLARQARASGASIVVFCGVEFMAETAAILCPDKTVLLPEREAGCSLAASITADDVRSWKAEHPDAVVVSYVNTTAAVKAESDYCCTSSNAQAIIEAIAPDREILFLPDVFLGLWLERVTGRRLRLWPGECHVHAGIRPADLDNWRARAPGAELLVHPECGCSSQALAFGDGAKVLSTEGMVRYAKESSSDKFLVATEVGILHRLRFEMPEKRFEPLREDAICQYMKLTTVESVYDALRLRQHVVRVPDEIAARARAALERMVATG